ncbi:MAG: hypothetical protein GY851_29065 [bacterium]|nr:hypothetical protein [bacterium]
MIFRGRSIDGRPVVDDPVALSSYCTKLGNVPIKVSITKWRDKRSGEQNRYLWGVVYRVLGEHIGYTDEELHEHCRVRFLRTTKATRQGRDMTVVRSTTSLDTKEMHDYIEAIRDWAAQWHDCVIPDANAAVQPEWQ